MRVPSLESLENSVFKKPANPRAASVYFGALLDVGVEPTLAGRAASSLARLYEDGLEFVRTVAHDRGANALLYDDDFREELKNRLSALETMSLEIPGHAAAVMDLLERRSGEPEDRARVRAWVDLLRRLSAQCHVESILDLPGEAGIEGAPFGAGAVGRVFRSLVVLVGLTDFLDEEELPPGLSAVALGDIFRELASRMRPAIVGDGRGWQGLVGYLNDFTSGGPLPPQ